MSELLLDAKHLLLHIKDVCFERGPDFAGIAPMVKRIDAALAAPEAMPEYPAIHVDVHGGKRVWKHEYDALRAYAMRSADMAASNLIDRALKMMECAGYRVAAVNADHNNPIIAWMADARAYLSSAEAMPEPSAEAVREACAAACDDIWNNGADGVYGSAAAACAIAIRALKVG